MPVKAVVIALDIAIAIAIAIAMALAHPLAPVLAFRLGGGGQQALRGRRVVLRQGVMRSRSQELTSSSAVAARAVGWPVKPWGDAG